MEVNKMNTCPNCNQPVEPGAQFCTSCGARFNNAQPRYDSYAPAQDANPYDHTNEFDPRDISDNKVVAMLIYLMGSLGIIIALFISNSSKYVSFHVRQALKIMVINILTVILMALLFWTLIVPIAATIMLVIMCVVKIICFFQICKGKAVEAPIVRSFDFMK